MSAQKRGEDPETSETPAPELSSVELFRELVKTAVAPPSLQEEMLARIALYGPDEQRGCVISLASEEQDAHDHVSRAVSETIARINNREPKKWRDLADRFGSLLLMIFLYTMAVGSVCGFALLWIKLLLTT